MKKLIPLMFLLFIGNAVTNDDLPSKGNLIPIATEDYLSMLEEQCEFDRLDKCFSLAETYLRGYYTGLEEKSPMVQPNLNLALDYFLIAIRGYNETTLNYFDTKSPYQDGTRSDNLRNELLSLAEERCDKDAESWSCIINVASTKSEGLRWKILGRSCNAGNSDACALQMAIGLENGDSISKKVLSIWEDSCKDGSAFGCLYWGSAVHEKAKNRGGESVKGYVSIQKGCDMGLNWACEYLQDEF